MILLCSSNNILIATLIDNSFIQPEISVVIVYLYSALFCVLCFMYFCVVF